MKNKSLILPLVVILLTLSGCAAFKTMTIKPDGIDRNQPPDTEKLTGKEAYLQDKVLGIPYFLPKNLVEITVTKTIKKTK